MSALDDWRKDQGRRNRPERPPEPPAPEVPQGTVYQRRRTLVATPGSQRRCYDGCFHPDDWEEVWTAWSELETNMPEDRLTFWRELGGGTARTQYKWEQNQ